MLLFCFALFNPTEGWSRLPDFKSQRQEYESYLELFKSSPNLQKRMRKALATCVPTKPVSPQNCIEQDIQDLNNSYVPQSQKKFTRKIVVPLVGKIVKTLLNINSTLYPVSAPCDSTNEDTLISKISRTVKAWSQTLPNKPCLKACLAVCISRQLMGEYEFSTWKKAGFSSFEESIQRSSGVCWDGTKVAIVLSKLIDPTIKTRVDSSFMHTYPSFLIGDEWVSLNSLDGIDTISPKSKCTFYKK